MENKSHKVLVNKIIPFSNVDGMGNRTSIFLQGCNLNCIYCHNPETINYCNDCMICLKGCKTGALKNINGKIVYDESLCVHCDTCIHMCLNSSSPKTKWYTVEELVEVIKLYKPYITGITVSGGEATLQKDFIIKLFEQVKLLGLTCYIDTNGFFDIEQCNELINITDKFLWDIKTINDSTVVGKEKNLKIPILNLKQMLKLNKIEEIRTVIIKDSDMKETVTYVSKLLSGYDHVQYKLIKVHTTGVKLNNKTIISQRLPLEEDIDDLIDIVKYEGVNNLVVIK